MIDKLNEMFRSIKESLISKKKDPVADDDAELLESFGHRDEIQLVDAYTYLLLSIALSDQNFDVEESDYLFAKIRGNFKISDAEIQGHLEKARLMQDSFRGSSSYVEFLKEKLSAEEKAKLVELLQGMVDADGKNEGFETYLRDSFIKALS